MSETVYRIIVMRSVDNVGVALQEIPNGTELEVRFSEAESVKFTLKETIKFGHKFAARPIKKGAEIKKYGEVIGKAIKDIQEGEHVHVHNLEGTRGRGDKIATD